jgi:hypothetical protein
MSLAPRAASIVCLAAAFIALPGCDGKRIRLGDATPGSGGSAGLSSGSAGLGGGAGASGGIAGSAALGGIGGAAGAGEPCETGLVAAGEVAWIGDTWITIPGTQHTLVRDYARASGAIGPDDDYVILGAGFQSMADIAVQYRTQQAGPTKLKVLVMDGGTWDTIQGNGSQASAESAAATFADFLDEVAGDGTVEHVIYFLMPELESIPGVEALRPLVRDACTGSAVPCYFIDLQPLWTRPGYTDASGIQASATGAAVIADAVWQVMQDNCIAQ